jgi:hypothetical protein
MHAHRARCWADKARAAPSFQLEGFTADDSMVDANDGLGNGLRTPQASSSLGQLQVMPAGEGIGLARTSSTPLPLCVMMCVRIRIIGLASVCRCSLLA